MKLSIPKVRRRRTSGAGGVTAKRPLIAIGLAGVLIVGGILPTALAADPPAAPTPSTRAGANVSPSSKEVKPGETWSGNKAVQTTEIPPKIDVMFVVDHTGSMNPPIRWASVGLQDAIKRIAASGANDIQMGIVSYGDNDKTQDCVPGYGHGTKEWFVNEMPLGANSTPALTAKLDQIAKNVTDWYYCNGLDPAESTFSAVGKVAVETKWRQDAARYIINVSDAPWKIQDATLIPGGFASNMDGLTKVLKATDVNLQIQGVNCDADTCGAWNQLASNLPAIAGIDVDAKLRAAGLNSIYAESDSAVELNNNIVVTTAGVVPDWKVTHEVTCTYESDGAPSKDISVSLSPETLTVKSGTIANFTEIATGSATPARGDETTNCKVQFFINGLSGGPEFAQNVFMKAPPTGAFEISKTAEPASGSKVLPGSTVKYTVVAKNTTTKSITGGTFTDDLRDILDDATVASSSIKVAGPGKAELKGDKIVWTGDLLAGESATVTYEAVVANPTPPGGNFMLKNNVSSTTGLSTCEPLSTDPACNTSHEVTGFMLNKTVDKKTPIPGEDVTYTITGLNNSKVPLTTSINDSLADVLDDADYNGDITSSVPVANIVESTQMLHWAGTLQPMQTVTITYSVRIKADGTTSGGNGILNNAITSPGDDTPCPEDDPDPAPECKPPPPVVKAITLFKTAEKSPPTATLMPGDTVKYKVVATNTGQLDIDEASFNDSMADVLDDATYNNDAAVELGGNGAVKVVGTDLVWTGKLAIRQSVTITYSVKIDSPPKGDKQLKNQVGGLGTNCHADPSILGCSTITPAPALQVAKVVVGSPSKVFAGDTVTYKLVAANNGKVDLPAAELTDDLTGVLDDATFDQKDVVVTPNVGTVTMAGNVLKWVGPINIGERVEISYKVVVKDVLGDRNLKNKVVSDVVGSTCAPNSVDPGCSTETEASSVRIVKTSDPAVTVAPGKTVDYTITVVNDSKGKADGVKVVDNLSEVLDDASIVESSLKSSVGAKPVFDKTAKTITWTGDVAAGQTVTITYRALVDYPSIGDLVMSNSVISENDGSTCPPYNDKTECGTSTAVSGDVVKKTNDVTGNFARPGQKVTYTVTVMNNSSTASKASTFTDLLHDVIDNATYNNDAAIDVAGLPAPVYDGTPGAETLKWTGPLAPNQTATITYSVTINDPVTGNGVLKNKLTEAGVCDAADPNPPEYCGTEDVIGGFTLKKTSNIVGKAMPGSEVTYTITGKNDGKADVKGAEFTDSLTEVLDDATFVNGSVTYSGGTANYDASRQQITWNGNVAKGQTIKVTYKVKVNDPVSGNMIMTNTVVSKTEGTNCFPANKDPNCTSTGEVGGFTIKKTSNVKPGTVSKPGTVVSYTVTATNNTLQDVAAASFVDDLNGVLDDATFNGSIVAVPDIGTTSFDAVAKTLTWSGPLSSKQSVAVTYSVTVGKAMGGDHKLSNGVSSLDPNTNCLPDSKDPDCSTTNETGGLIIKKSADVPSGEAVSRGKVLTYTVVAHNDSAADMSGAKWVDDLSNVLDDADYVAGSLTLVSGGGKESKDGNLVSWTGDLAKGSRSIVTYQVKVKDHGVSTTGNNSLVNEVTTESDLGTCPPGNNDPDCREVHPIAGLTIVKSADVPSGEAVDAGQVVTYTVKAKNTGSEKIVGAKFKDDMTNVLNAAVLDQVDLPPAATKGKVTFDAGTKIINWVGDLNPGEEAVVTYRVKINSDGHSSTSKISNKVESDNPGTNCPPGNNDPLCAIPNPISAVEVSKTANPTGPVGVNDIITYTVNVKNSGSENLVGIEVIDDLTDVNDDAWVIRDSLSATSGTVAYARGDTTLKWVGDLKIGKTASFTYQVNIREPFQANGNKNVKNLIFGGENSNCFAGSDAPACSTSSAVRAVLFSVGNDKAAGQSVRPGEVINYTVESLNWGGTNEAGLGYELDLSGVLDDATVDQSSIKASFRNAGSDKAPAATFEEKTGTLAWTGDLPRDQELEVTFKAVVNDEVKGDRAIVAKLASSSAGTNCPIGSSDPRCIRANNVAGVNITTESDIDPALGFAQTSQVVNYTITAENTVGGPTDTLFSYDLSGLLDDATLVGDITTTVADGSRASNPAKLNPAGTAIDWAGQLDTDEVVTTTFAAQVNLAGKGNRVLSTLAVGDNVTNCAEGSQSPDCFTTANVKEINFSKTVDKTGTVKAGDVVTYTVAVNNVGTEAYPGVSFADNLSEVLDDATFVSVTQDSGKAVYNAPVISWSGDLAAGQIATVKYSVKVKEGRPGDGSLFNRVTTNIDSTNCPAGSLDPACSTTTKIDPPVKIGGVTLPVTGIELGRLVAGAGLALLLGATALLIARRRTVKGEEV